LVARVMADDHLIVVLHQLCRSTSRRLGAMIVTCQWRRRIEPIEAACLAN